MYEDDEKGAKIQRQAARAQLIQALLCFGVLISMISIFTTRYHHNPIPKIRGRNVKGNSSTNATADAVPSLPILSIYRLAVQDASGARQSLEKYAGMVTLIVNTACKWGKTDTDFTQLAALQSQFPMHRGFAVLAFPIADFHQELATDAEIQAFLQEHYPDTNFPVFGVSTLRENPVYQRLREQLPKESVQHNFFKYLVGPDGMALHLYPKARDPITLTEDIERALHKKDFQKVQ
jgi:glutathione peroxidase-family protein